MSAVSNTSFPPLPIGEGGGPPPVTKPVSWVTKSYNRMPMSDHEIFAKTTLGHAVVLNVLGVSFSDIKSRDSNANMISTSFSEFGKAAYRHFSSLGASSIDFRWAAGLIEFGFGEVINRNLAIGSTFEFNNHQFSAIRGFAANEAISKIEFDGLTCTNALGRGPELEERIKTWLSEFGEVLQVTHVPMFPDIPGCYTRKATAMIIPSQKLLSGEQVIPRFWSPSPGTNIRVHQNGTPRACTRCYEVGHFAKNCTKYGSNGGQYAPTAQKYQEAGLKKHSRSGASLPSQLLSKPRNQTPPPPQNYTTTHTQSSVLNEIPITQFVTVKPKGNKTVNSDTLSATKTNMNPTNPGDSDSLQSNSRAAPKEDQRTPPNEYDNSTRHSPVPQSSLDPIHEITPIPISANQFQALEMGNSTMDYAEPTEIGEDTAMEVDGPTSPPEFPTIHLDLLNDHTNLSQPIVPPLKSSVSAIEPRRSARLAQKTAAKSAKSIAPY